MQHSNEITDIKYTNFEDYEIFEFVRQLKQYIDTQTIVPSNFNNICKDIQTKLSEQMSWDAYVQISTNIAKTSAAFSENMIRYTFSGLYKDIYITIIILT